MKDKFKRLNKAVAGTGFQFYVEHRIIRIENESGDFLRTSPDIEAAIRSSIPFGCGGNGVEYLIEIANYCLTVDGKKE